MLSIQRRALHLQAHHSITSCWLGTLCTWRRTATGQLPTQRGMLCLGQSPCCQATELQIISLETAPRSNAELPLPSVGGLNRHFELDQSIKASLVRSGWLRLLLPCCTALHKWGMPARSTMTSYRRCNACHLRYLVQG